MDAVVRLPISPTLVREADKMNQSGSHSPLGDANSLSCNANSAQQLLGYSRRMQRYKVARSSAKDPCPKRCVVEPQHLDSFSASNTLM